MSSASQTEQVKAWHLKHPDYYRQWTKSYQAWRDSEHAAGRNVRGPSRARTKGNKLAYSINVSHPLTEIEKEEITHVRESIHCKASGDEASSGEDFKYQGN